MYNQQQTDFRPVTGPYDLPSPHGKWIPFDSDNSTEHVAAMTATLTEQTSSFHFLEREAEIILDRPAPRYSVLHPAAGPSGMSAWRARRFG